MKQLDPKVKNIFFVNYFMVWLASSYVILSFFLSILSVLLLSTSSVLVMIAAFAIGPIFIAIIVARIFAGLSYEAYKYSLTDDGVKMEKGVIYKKYSLVPYERIQNIDIHRGILDRYFGLSRISIQTAGASGVYGAEISLPGLLPSTAEEIRTFLISKAKKDKSQGL